MSEDAKQTWKSIAAYVYLLICVFDFLIMPAYISHLNNKFIQETLAQVEPDTRSYILEIIDRVKIDKWNPVTLQSGYVFHISFGLILGGAAFTSRSWTLSANGLKSEPNIKVDKDKEDN